eukprot:TRINITY_DN27352_c0_g2_i1.p1 TRINITY_DN27352_c0_g2~~TRINITY_DN27352_c0_g2_i1.p1  ORF type:complete len:266 (+),score=29.43 TRINITY_DN27352_c0_g2_i1:91-888(+)
MARRGLANYDADGDEQNDTRWWRELQRGDGCPDAKFILSCKASKDSIYPCMQSTTHASLSEVWQPGLRGSNGSRLPSAATTPRRRAHRPLHNAAAGQTQDPWGTATSLSSASRAATALPSPREHRGGDSERAWAQNLTLSESVNYCGRAGKSSWHHNPSKPSSCRVNTRLMPSACFEQDKAPHLKLTSNNFFEGAGSPRVAEGSSLLPPPAAQTPRRGQAPFLAASGPSPRNTGRGGGGGESFLQLGGMPVTAFGCRSHYHPLIV